MTPQREACPVSRAARSKRYGLAWLLASLLVCPCHIGLTFGVVLTLLSGSAVGAAISSHPNVAAAALVFGWVAITWRGIGYLRSAPTDFSVIGIEGRSRS